MSNGPFISDFPSYNAITSIHRGFSIAMFDETRGYPSHLLSNPHRLSDLVVDLGPLAVLHPMAVDGDEIHHRETTLKKRNGS